MKKLSFLVFSVLILSASEISAQGFHLGIKAGANLTSMSGRSFNDGFKFGYLAGAFAELNVTSKWGIQPEVLFSQTNTTTASSFSSIIPTGYNDVDVKLNYLTIPILLSYKPIPILSVQLGPQFGILMNSNQSIAGNGKAAFKSGDFGIAAGAQLNLASFKIGARYAFGLTDVNNVNDVDSWKNQGLQLYIGFRLL